MMICAQAERPFPQSKNFPELAAGLFETDIYPLQADTCPAKQELQRFILRA